MSHPHLGNLIDANDPTQVDAYLHWWDRPGRVILGERLDPDLDDLDANVYTGERTEGALTIVQGCSYDPGNAVYRFHSALNATTPHASMFFRHGNNNPYVSYRQLDFWRHRPELMVAVGTADLVIGHVDTFMLGYVMVRRRGQLVVYYHGSEHPDDKKSRTPFTLVNQHRDDLNHAIQLGARLDHQDYGDLAWVPMAQPVRRLYALRQMYKLPGVAGKDRPFRIAHSPTFAKIKGTDTLLTTVDKLRGLGLNVEVVLIQGHQHPQALAWKATCDACFDSFWLGLQGSGLEAGAMGMPVIAGDAHIRELHERHVGYCPYWFADSASQLEDAIVTLVSHDWAYEEAAATMRRYVWHWHNYDTVAAMFLNAVAERATDPALGELIRQAMHTPPDGSYVPAMRATDDLPWLKDDPPQIKPKVVTPDGEPVHTPKRRPVHLPQKPKPYHPQPEKVVER